MDFGNGDLGNFTAQESRREISATWSGLIRACVSPHPPGRKAPPTAADDQGRDFFALLQLLQSRQQLVHHLEIDDVERRMVDSDAGEWPRTSTANRFVVVVGMEEVVIGFPISAILGIWAFSPKIDVPRRDRAPRLHSGGAAG